MNVICVICLDVITKNPSGQTEIDEVDIIATKCGHVYHMRCLQDWLLEKESKVCPNCNESIIDETEHRKLFLSEDEDTDEINNNFSEMKRKIKLLEADNLALKDSAAKEAMLLDILRFEYEELHKDSKFEISMLSKELQEVQEKMSSKEAKAAYMESTKVFESPDGQEKEIYKIFDKILEDVKQNCGEFRDVMKELAVALNKCSTATPTLTSTKPNDSVDTSNSSKTDGSDSLETHDILVSDSDSANSSSSVVFLRCKGSVSSDVLDCSTTSSSPNKISFDTSDSNSSVIEIADEESINSETLQLLIKNFP